MNDQEFKIALISNIVFEPYLRTELERVFQRSAQSVTLTCIPYEDCGTAELQSLGNTDMVFAALNFEEFYPDHINDVCAQKRTYEDLQKDAVCRCEALYAALKKNTAAPILWLGFEDAYYPYDAVCGTVPMGQGLVDRINGELQPFISAQDTFIDWKRLIAQVGIPNAYDRKGKYRWNAPYSKAMIAALCGEVYQQYLIHQGTSKKCIVLDCDNVLWGGILSEDGIEKIQLGNGLGRPYQDFQRFLLTLYYHGVLLTVCSKNDEADVLRVFSEHSGMILKKEHIACFKVNWDNKPANIKKISEALNIGLNSMVFIDDSPFEIHGVQALLPEVTTVLYHRDTVYENLSCFHLKSKVDLHTVEQRNETYRTNIKRERLKDQSVSFQAYLKELQTNIDIHIALPAELARIAELTQRTNKCTNGARYTVDQLKKKIQYDGYRLYSVSVSDRFSDLGIVGAMGIEKDVLDLFSLSCRALGREVEKTMFSTLAQHPIAQISFTPTEKNKEFKKMMQQMLHRHDF